MKKIYDTVKNIMETNKATRDNDDLLVWEVLKVQKIVKKANNKEYITKEGYLQSVSKETITRVRRKLEEIYPDLRGYTYKLRQAKAKKNKGTHIYREELSKKDIKFNSDGTVSIR